jgi:pentatricopeptide repeat protein
LPDLVTYVCLLKSCGDGGTAEIGKTVHSELVRLGLHDRHLVAGNALLGMYARCGLLPAAEKVLESLETPDVVSWNALIVGYSKQGDLERALAQLCRMQASGISPNSATFRCLLSACRRRCPSDPARVAAKSVFLAMLSLKPGIDDCLVHLLGDVGGFDTALDVMQVMPSWHRLLPAWHVLLCSCQRWVNQEIGRFAFGNLVCLG